MKQYAEGREFVGGRGRPGRHGGLQPRSGRARRPCRASRSSPIRSAGWSGCTAARPSRPDRRSDAWPARIRRSRGSAAPSGRAWPPPTGRCSSPAAGAPTRSRWPRPSPSRRRAPGVPAGAVTVDHGLQPGSAERAAAHGRPARATCGLDPVQRRAGRRSARRRRAGGRRPDGPVRRAAAAAPAHGARVALGHTARRPGRDRAARAGPRVRDRGRSPAWSSTASDDGVAWWRPLLGVRRATTRAACAALELPVWDDPWNADPAYRRVRLRTEVLPLLEEVLGGGVAAALARTGGAAARGPRRPRRPGRRPSSRRLGERRRAARPTTWPRCPPRCAAGCCAAGCGGRRPRSPGRPPGRRRRAAHPLARAGPGGPAGRRGRRPGVWQAGRCSRPATGAADAPTEPPTSRSTSA